MPRSRGSSGASRFTSGHRCLRCSPTCVRFDAFVITRDTLSCPSTVSDSLYIVTYKVNLYRISGITRVVVRWICSGFSQGFAPTSRQFPPYIHRIDRAIGFRRGSDTTSFKRCCRYIIFLAHSSVVSQIFLLAPYFLCVAQGLSVPTTRLTISLI